MKRVKFSKIKTPIICRVAEEQEKDALIRFHLGEMRKHGIMASELSGMNLQDNRRDREWYIQHLMRNNGYPDFYLKNGGRQGRDAVCNDKIIEIKTCIVNSFVIRARSCWGEFCRQNTEAGRKAAIEYDQIIYGAFCPDSTLIMDPIFVIHVDSESGMQKHRDLVEKRQEEFLSKNPLRDSIRVNVGDILSEFGYDEYKVYYQGIPFESSSIIPILKSKGLPVVVAKV